MHNHWEINCLLVSWRLLCRFTQIDVGIHGLEFAQVTVFLYKSTRDANNLGSLGCVILVIALQLQQQLLIVTFVLPKFDWLSKTYFTIHVNKVSILCDLP